jgi:hypothetical protein
VTAGAMAPSKKWLYSDSIQINFKLFNSYSIAIEYISSNLLPHSVANKKGDLWPPFECHQKLL